MDSLLRQDAHTLCTLSQHAPGKSVCVCVLTWPVTLQRNRPKSGFMRRQMGRAEQSRASAADTLCFPGGRERKKKQQTTSQTSQSLSRSLSARRASSIVIVAVVSGDVSDGRNVTDNRSKLSCFNNGGAAAKSSGPVFGDEIKKQPRTSLFKHNDGEFNRWKHRLCSCSYRRRFKLL